MNVTQVFWLTASNRLLACRIRCGLSSRTTRQPKWLCYSVQPIHRVQQTPKLRVVYVQRRQPFADSFAFPPRFVANWRKLIAIQPCSNVMRRRVGKGMVRQERQRAAIVMPDLPVNPRLVRRHEWRPAVQITWFGFELVFLPFRVVGNQHVVGSLKNDFVAFPAHCTECAVSVHKIKRIERVVHQLAPGYEIEHGGYAQPDNHYREYDRDSVVDARRLRLLRRVFCAPNDGAR